MIYEQHAACIHDLSIHVNLVGSCCATEKPLLNDL